METSTPNEEHFRRLENMYGFAPCNQASRPKLVVSAGRALVSIPVSRMMFHAAGGVHGSLYFKALDDAAFFAANSLVEDVFVLTTSFEIKLLRGVNRGMLRAEGTVRRKGSTLIVCESVLKDDQGEELAFGSGVFVRSNVKLTEDIGYALR